MNHVSRRLDGPIVEGNILSLSLFYTKICFSITKSYPHVSTPMLLLHSSTDTVIRYVVLMNQDLFLSWLFVQRTLYRGQPWVLAAVEGWLGQPGQGDWRGQAWHGALHCQLPLPWGILTLLQQYGGPRPKYTLILLCWNVCFKGSSHW